MCPEHFIMPKSNLSYWEPKLSRNVERDRKIDLTLEHAGWCVMHYWEHEDPDAVATAIERQLQAISRSR